MNHTMAYDPPDLSIAFGPTQVLDWLWLGGEEDVDEPLRTVDVWMDLRNEDNPWNRRILVPPHVTVIRMPFNDGDVDAANRVLPVAKDMLDRVRDRKQTALVSCHAGSSRSAVLALWCLAESLQDYDGAWCRLKELRPHVEPHSAFWPILSQIRGATQSPQP